MSVMQGACGGEGGGHQKKRKWIMGRGGGERGGGEGMEGDRRGRNEEFSSQKWMESGLECPKFDYSIVTRSDDEVLIASGCPAYMIDLIHAMTGLDLFDDGPLRLDGG